MKIRVNAGILNRDGELIWKCHGYRDGDHGGVTVGKKAWEVVDPPFIDAARTAVVAAINGSPSQIYVKVEGHWWRAELYPVRGVAGCACLILSHLLDATWGELTERERDFLRHYLDTQNVKEIARRMGVSVSTAETHRRNLRNKTKCESNESLAIWAYEHLGGAFKEALFDHIFDEHRRT